MPDHGWESERNVANTIGVPSARRHIFLCADQTTPKCCDKDRGLAAWNFLKYGRCDPPVLERIIHEHLIGGHAVQEFLITAHPLVPER